MVKRYNEKHPRRKDTRQANTIIVVASIIGLAAVVILAPQRDAPSTLVLYGIFGGSIVGTDNMIRFFKAILGRK